MTTNEIIELRKSLGMTQEQFARLVGVTMNTVYRWEKGRNPTPLAEKRLQEIKQGAI